MIVEIHCITGAKHSVDVSSDDLISKVRTIVSKLLIVPENQFNLIRKSRYLMENKTVAENNIGESDIVYVTLKLHGGGFQFTNLEKKGLNLESHPQAPRWRIVGSGLNLEGECRNADCESFSAKTNSLVIVQMGFGEFDIGSEACRDKLQCPICTCFVKPITCGFWDCMWSWEGEKEMYKDYVYPVWKATIDQRYLRFENSEENLTEWKKLIIYSKPIKTTGNESIC